MIYRFIKNHETLYPLEKICKVLGIGLGSYYVWKSNAVSDRKQRAILIKKEIETVYFKKQRYGSPRIAIELNVKGIRFSRNTVAKYMKELGLRSKMGRKFRTTTDSKHTHRIMENHLNREFRTTEPTKVWVSNITYIHTKDSYI